MFGIIKSLTKATVNAVVTPVDVVKDVLTCGDVENDATYTGRRLDKIGKNLKKAGKQFEELLDDE